MFRGSLTFGPTLRSGLPPYGRHHYTALMQEDPYSVPNEHWSMSVDKTTKYGLSARNISYIYVIKPNSWKTVS